MFKIAVVAAGAALFTGSAIAADLIVNVPGESFAEPTYSAWQGVVEVGGLGRLGLDYDSGLDEEAWFPGAYASFALWGDLGLVKLGIDGYGELLSGDFEGDHDLTNANLGVLGAHLGFGDDVYAGVFGAVATYPNDDADEQFSGYAVGVEGMVSMDAAILIGRLGYAYAPNISSNEGFTGLFVEGAVQFSVSDELALEASAGYGYSNPYDTTGQDGQYINWGLKAVYALPTEFDLNLVASYEGLVGQDLVDTEEFVVNHTFKLGLSVPFGGAGTASDSLKPLTSPRAPFQASVLADVM